MLAFELRVAKACDDADDGCGDDEAEHDDRREVRRRAARVEHDEEPDAYQDERRDGGNRYAVTVQMRVVEFGIVYVGDMHAAAHEVVEVRMVKVAQHKKLVGLGEVDARLPLRDGLTGNAELLGEGFLGDTVMLAYVDEVVCKAHGFGSFRVWWYCIRCTRFAGPAHLASAFQTIRLRRRNAQQSGVAFRSFFRAFKLRSF